MKKKILLMLAVMAMLVCIFAISVSAETVHNENTVDYSATVTLNDGTVCNLFDSEGNALIWYIDENSETGYSSIRADANSVGGPYVDYKCSWTSGSQYQLGTVSITDASGNTFANTTIVVFNIMDDDVLLTSGSKTGVPMNCLAETFKNCANIQYAYLRLDTVYIYAFPFQNCTALKYVNLAEIPTLKGIKGEKAFGGCTSLFDGEVLDLSKTSLVQFGDGGGTFEGVAFKGVVLPDTVTTIGHYVFQSCSKLESFHFPSSVTEIKGNTTFKDCTSLKTVTGFENLNITAVVTQMFWNCTSLESVTLPSTITTIGTKAFYNCKALESIDFPSGLTKIEADGTWKEGAFTNCTSLKSITIPASVTLINGKAFQGCTALETVTFESRNGANITFGEATFEKCSSLKELIIPEGITEITNCFASECTGLQKISLPTTLTTLSGKQNFYHAGNNSATESIEILGLENTQIVTFPTDCFRQNRNWKVDELRLPNTCTTINNYAFADASVGTFYIGANVTTIGEGALGYNKSLKVMYLPSTVTSIHKDAVVNNSSALYVVVGVDDKSSTVIDTIETAVQSGKEETAYIAYADYAANPINYTGKNIVYGGNVCEIFYKGNHQTTQINTCVSSCSVCKNTIINHDVTAEKITIAYVTFDKVGTKTVACTNEGCTHGTTEEAPSLFTCLGYSAPENGAGGIAIGFTVNNEAIEEYEAITGTTVKYGVFAILKDRLGANDIFAEDGALAEGAIEAEISNHQFALFELKIVGFEDDQKDIKLAMGAYVALTDGETTEYSYMQGGTPNEGEKYYFVSYNDIVKPSTDTDTPATDTGVTE